MRVKIIKPDFFLRCGYPMDHTATKQEIIKEYTADINALVAKVIGRPVIAVALVAPSKVIDDIAGRLAFAKLSSCGFGGRKRSIYTESRPEFEGTVHTVLGTRFVVTGTYEPGFGGSPWDSEPEPPQLVNQQRHRIFDLGPFEIESVNCEILK